MASAVDQGQLRSTFMSSQSMNKNVTPRFKSQDAYSLDHLSVFDPPSTSVDPAFSKSSWASSANIWKTSASHFGDQDDRQPMGALKTYSEKKEDSELTIRSASTAAPDKKPVARSTPLYNTSVSQHDVNQKSNDVLQHAPTAHMFQPSLTSRPTASLTSPTRFRSQGLLSSGTAPPKSTLSNAALLSGSAPDLETSSKSSQSAHLMQMENQFKKLNIGRVHDFVPSWQTRQSQANTFVHGHERSSCTDCSEPGCIQTSGIPFGGRASVSNEQRRDSDGFGYSSRALHEGLWFDSGFDDLSNRSYHQEQPLANPRLAKSLTRRYQPESRPPFISSDIPQPGNFGAQWSEQFDKRTNSLQMNHASSPYVTSVQQETQGTLSHLADGYRYALDNRAAYFENRDNVSAPNHAIKNGLYTPAFTPPTASESHRSTSGSAPSTRASSQTVDSSMHHHDHYLPVDPLFSSHEAHFVNNCCSTYQYFNDYADMCHHKTVDHMEKSGLYSSVESREDPNKPVSPFLREFKANCKTKHYALKDVYNYIVEFSGDQHGSRFIQDKLASANSDEKERVFTEVRENALQLMTDIFGNYVVQKMFEHGTQAQKKSLASQMKGRVLYLTTQVYGCRVVQKALEHVLVEQQISMVQELCGHVLPVVENQNGNHVIQKAIELIPSEHIGFVADALRGQVVHLAKHNYGCRVIQRMLEYSDTPIRKAIFDELYPDIPSLITDTFGNYVVQNIIRSKKPKEADDEEDQRNKSRVVELVKQQLLYYSKHKFASNVVEVAIDFSSEKQQQEILRELTGSDGHGPSPVYNLIRDQYGNYVIQKVLSKVHGQQLFDLVQEIRHHLVTLRRVHNGRQVAAMEKALMDATSRREAGIAPPGLYSANTYSHFTGSSRAGCVPFSPQRTPGISSFMPMHSFRA